MKEYKYECMGCGIRFNSTQLAVYHLWNKHDEVSEEEDLSSFYYVNGEVEQ